ncbi:MAG: hypothetical protein R2706_09410 [Acidimicrobiales bacterium]
MQVMTIEYGRNVLGLTGAHSSEFNTATDETPYPVIDLMDSQRDVTDKGGTMRLGAYVAVLDEGSQVAKIYGETVVKKRHRHRFEFNPKFKSRYEESGFRCSGNSPDGHLVEFIELPGHPFWVGTQPIPNSRAGQTDQPRCSRRSLTRRSISLRPLTRSAMPKQPSVGSKADDASI